MRDMTPRTMYGSVDLAPLLRTLQGDTGMRVPSWEKPAAIAALTDMGLGVEQIAALVHMSGTDTTEAVRKYKQARHTHQVVERAVIGHAIWIARSQAKLRERTKAANAKARAKRLAERVLVDGHWFHPRAPHGTNTGYNGFGCRCRGPEGCHEAHMQAQRDRRAAS
ncbi:hypothetical protein [Glycomyces paridis]|uniref:Uncharacterized protein n=1 Tax=Glycomyces paridis TaxID=2126555 RepID=A0A4S8P6T7_9ACTN|nr:hypothetical protein [Glycomyces paridis]THV25980.1 hypothetical protein E9998_19800 [Glycomyces paridis]